MVGIRIRGGCLVCDRLSVGTCDVTTSAGPAPHQESLIPLVCVWPDGVHQGLVSVLPSLNVGMYVLHPNGRARLAKPSQPEIE